MKVLFHADGGVGVGLGHASRCRGLVGALLRAGHVAKVLVEASSGLASNLSQFQVPIIEGSSEPVAFGREADRMGADVMVIDSYRWGASDFTVLRNGKRFIVAFDDEARRELPVDAIINGAPIASRLSYKALPHTKMWLGPAYQVVREEFRNVPKRKAAGPVRALIVLVGGDDQLGLLPVLAEFLDGLAVRINPDVEIQLICGPYAPSLNSALRNIKVFRHPSDLRDRMLAADLALSAGGQTLYELARCGTPTIAFCSGQDQMHNLSALAEQDVVWDVGRADQPGFLAAIQNGILALASDESCRNKMAMQGQIVVDGRGADRVVVALEKMVRGENSGL